MGGGGSKTHQSFTVTPTLTEPAADDAPVDAIAAGDEALMPFWATLAQLQQVAQLQSPGTPASYEQLAAATAAAQSELAAAAAGGAITAQVAEGEKAIKAATAGFLAAVPAEQLQQWAAEHGFEHPHLVGLSGTATHPLAHWLDPAYPPQTPSKVKIAAKAAERYGLLAAGGQINGLTLEQLHQLEAQAGMGAAHAAGSWTATPADLVAAQTAVAEKLAAFTGKPMTGGTLQDLIDAENHLVSAGCPQLPAEQLAAAQAAAKASIDAALAKTPPWQLGQYAITPVVNGAVVDAKLTTSQAAVLSRADQLQLLRLSTSAAERDALTAMAAKRAKQLTQLQRLTGAVAPHKLDLHSKLQLPDGDPAALAAFAHTAGCLNAAHQAVAGWQPKAADPPTIASAHPPTAAGVLTPQFRAWAKNQPIGPLRVAAGQLGLTDATHATRAEVQNYIAASWDPSLSKNEVQHAVSSKHAAKTNPAAKAKPAPVAAAAATSTTAAAAPTAPPAPTSFAAKHLALVAALKQHAAATTALPPRRPAAEVANWTFTPTGAAHGGVHTKTLVAAPDGSSWMFKPDSMHGGAIAHSEAAAASVMHAVGLPAVDVHVSKVGGKVGCVQPMVGGVSTVNPNPGSWTQSDVDAFVRMHVAAWAVGDHDGKAENVLRTTTGGLIRCDHGASFKFYGADKLDSSYHPHGSYGASAPVFLQAYEAGKSGGLGKGVTVRAEAALPVIKAFEQLGDSQYRTMLHRVAHEGAKADVVWAKPMRSRAAKRHGIAASSVTTSQVAEEFLDYAVARKNGLRKAFAAFFTAEGFAGADKLTAVR